MNTTTEDIIDEIKTLKKWIESNEERKKQIDVENGYFKRRIKELRKQIPDPFD